MKGVHSIDGRFINMAARNWWAYRIAAEYSISPVEVKSWELDDVMEALAAIKISEDNQKKQENKRKPQARRR